MYRLSFYAPKSHCEQIKNKLFEKGAGRVGNYDCCAWQTLGAGQFRPNMHSNPYMGQKNQIETVEEYKVEMVCDDQYIEEVVQALIDAHPYETPAYSVCKLDNL